MSLNAFQPQGNTVLVAASSSTGAAATQISTNPGVAGLRITYPTTTNLAVPVYIALGSSSVAAAVPTTSAPAAGMPISPGADVRLSYPQNLTNNWISAVTSAGTAAPGIFVTPGFGQ